MQKPMLPEYPEPKMRALARNLLQNNLRLKRGENLLIETWSGTYPWAVSLAVEARILGARPMLLVEDEEAYWKTAAEAPEANLGQVGSHDWAALKASDAYVYLYGPVDTVREEALPKSVLARIDANDHEWFRLVEKYGVRSVRWDLGRTNEGAARRYGVELKRWRSELVEAASVDPKSLLDAGSRIAVHLRKGREVRITHPNGTALTLRLAGRRPRVDDGMVDEEDVRQGDVFSIVPSGVTTVSVDETYAEGTFVANITGVMLARHRETPLRGARWTFEGGRLTEHSFEAGEEEFRRVYASVGKGRDRPGMLSIGLNPQISSIPLLFDQERGVVTIAVGRNAHVGGKTRTPHFTAYESLRGATVEIDGRRIVEDGELS